MPTRPTGLRVLGEVPWGQHVGFFYEEKEDLFDVCIPFLTAGLESHEVCFWVIARPLTKKDAWAALGRAVPALEQYRADACIDIIDSQTLYMTGNRPDLQKVARGWETKLADALGRGYEGVRVAASAPHLEEKHWP